MVLSNSPNLVMLISALYIRHPCSEAVICALSFYYYQRHARYLDLDSCLQAAKLTAAAGEMAPFPFVKGVAQCVVVILEIIQVCRDFSFRQSLP